MKHLLTTILILLTLTVKADFKESLLDIAFTGLPVFGAPVYKNIHTDYDRNCLIVSPSFDPKLLLLGDKRYGASSVMDFKARTQLRVGRLWHPFIAWEVCPWAELKAYTGGVQYKFYNGYISALIGIETGMIKNQGKKVWTNGINFEIEKWTRHGFAITYLGEYMSRPELSQPRMIYTGRITLKLIL